MNISAQDVNKLRQQTGVGMMDCKKALVEAEGDFDKAIELLRKKGQKVSAARADRNTQEGSVFTAHTPDHTRAVIAALGCETDFVAKNEEFQAIGTKIAALALAQQPAGLTELLALELEGKPVQEALEELMGKMGEKIALASYKELSSDQAVSYIHTGGKLGVLVALSGTTSDASMAAGKDVAMQIAAMKPLGVSKDNIDEATIERELSIAREEVRAQGKPEEMIDRIAQGKLQKFFKENTLLAQPFVKDSNMSVEQYLQSIAKDLTVTAFERVSVV